MAHGHSHSHGHSHGHHGPSHVFDPNDPSRHSRSAQHITVIGVGVNIGLTVSKATIGIIANSASMLADAVHSLSDLISDGTTLLAVKFSRRQPTERFPYGYGKLETLCALGISGLLISAGGGMAVHSIGLMMGPGTVQAVNLMATHAHDAPLYAALAAAVLSIISKEALYHATIRVARAINSPVLVANAWHHRSDAWSSIVALAGIGGNLAGYPLLDPICGLIVSGMIVRMGTGIGWQSVLELLDAAPDMHPVTTSVLAALPPGCKLHDLKARKMGPFTHIDFKMSVQPSMHASAAVEIIEEIKHKITEKFPGTVTVELIAPASSRAKLAPTQNLESSSEHSHSHGHGHHHH